MIGQIISHYRLIKLLGKGSFGEVYLADDLILPRQAAIKISKAKIDDIDSWMRFKREAAILASLDHPNIATIYEYDETEDGKQYFVMEFIEGHTLQEVLKSGALPSLERCLSVITEIAEALKAAHSKHVIHRDLKPSNVMLTFSGGVKVVDFGLAKRAKLEVALDADTLEEALDASLTKPGMFMGTVRYASPEQAKGERADERSDLFSLGAVLYECLTGIPAFSGESNPEVLRQIIYVMPLPLSSIKPEVPAEFDQITCKALAKKPAERYQSADELLAKLRSVNIEHNGATITPQTEPLLEVASSPTFDPVPSTKVFTLPAPSKINEPTSTAMRRSKLLAIGAVLVGMLLLILIGRVWWAASHLAMPSKNEARLAYEKGLTALRVGAYSQAHKAFEEVIRMEPGFAGGHVRLAEALIELGQSEEAKKKISDARECFSPLDSLWSLDALYLRATDLMTFRKLDKAVEVYQQIVLRSFQDGQWMAENDLGRALEKNNQPQDALRCHQRAYDQNPQQPRTLTRLGALYGRGVNDETVSAEQKDPLKLLKDAETACSNTGDFQVECRAEVVYQRGVVFYLRGLHNQAAQQFNQALRLINPNYPDESLPENQFQEVRMLLRLSQSANEAGDRAAKDYALTALDKAKKYNLSSLIPHAYIELGNSSNSVIAEDNFQTALKLADTQNPVAKARAQLSLASLYVQGGQMDKGMVFLQPALDFYKQGDYRAELAQAHALLGQIYTAKGKFTLARQEYQQQLQLAERLNSPSQEASAYFWLGSTCMVQERYPEAKRCFERSRSLNEQLKQAEQVFYSRLYLAEVRWRLGEHEAANLELTDLAVQAEDSWLATICRAQAQLHLSWGKREEARAFAKRAIDQAQQDDQQTVTEAKYILGLALTLDGQPEIGLPLCKEAVDRAELAKDEMLKSQARLAWAEALLKAQRPREAFEQAETAFKHFSGLEQWDSAWRSALFAARAAERKGDTSPTNDYGEKSRTALAKLEQQWGREFIRYLNRTDIKQYRDDLMK